MAPFFYVDVRRSDGKYECETKSKQKELNEPTKEQLDNTPNEKGVSDYYKELKEGEAKELDWRRKLGGMLMRQVGDEKHRGKFTFEFSDFANAKD